MTTGKSTSTSKTCPTCGTRISENATRCLVCGRVFTAADSKAVSKPIQGPRIPEITLSLPIALGLIALILVVGAGTVFFLLQSTGRVVEPTITPTNTATLTITITPTASLTPTLVPSFTPLPPFEYTVQSNDTCSVIAGSFNVSINSIVLLNNLPADCGVLSIGQKLIIPQPTPTASPLPTSTLSAADATEEACDKIDYTVGEYDTFSSISANYNVSIEAIKEYNQITTDIVYQGQLIIIPLCRRNPTPGPTPTATLPPPYLAPNLLLPAHGSVFLNLNETITLQWASVGTLRENEFYMVTIEDITEGTGRKLVDYVVDTKYIVPTSFRPSSDTPHIIQWWITPVRQTGTTEDMKPIYDTAGAPSENRVFSWSGTSIATPTP
jgi:LysM repeat protein